MNLPAARDADAPAGPDPRRSLGRFALLQLLGTSRATMAWRVHDPRGGGERFLVLPRVQPADAGQAEAWDDAVTRAARLRHPNLAVPLEVGHCDRWPYVLYDAAGTMPFDDWLRTLMPGAVDTAGVLEAALQGLAFAHDGGVAHRDIQPYMLLIGEGRQASLMGLEIAFDGDAPAPAAPGAGRTAVEALALHAQREAARRDVLGVALLLHLGLVGQPALDEPDLGIVIDRMPPRGRELVRLPWAVSQPVPEALRAICNRGSDRQERHRYRGARSMARALEGWLQAEASAGGGPIALLLDRLQSVGALPASPGSAARAARLAMMDKHRTNELAQVVLQDLALSFELLRWVNSAQVRGAQIAGSGPVLTVRRAIAMLGLDGVRRAALGLREWPGPLGDSAAQALRDLFDTVKRAGRVAQAIRPAGYDAEVVHLVTMLQNLGRLITAYHFPGELQQIGRLMQPAPAEQPGVADEPGMDEQAASYAVLGTDVEAIGAAVARHWGLDDTVLHLIRRLPLATMPRSIDNDDDMLRAVASCANEAVDALALPKPQRRDAVRRVAQRYGRALRIKLRDLEELLNLAPARPGGNDRQVEPIADARADGADAGADAPWPEAHATAAESASPQAATQGGGAA